MMYYTTNTEPSQAKTIRLFAYTIFCEVIRIPLFWPNYSKETLFSST